MKIGIVALGFVMGWTSAAASVQAEIDQRPLEVGITQAFPKLLWPDSLTGADTGKAKDLLPVAITGSGDGSNCLFVVTQYGHIFSFENSS